jgi:hypothetical protein
MMTQGQCNTGLTRVAISVVGVLAITLLLAATANAETLSRYHPQALADAEWALEQGEPEQALAHLHRQRALLQQDKFRAQRNALVCQAYRQMKDLQGVARVCREAVAFEGEVPVAKAYESTVGK